MSPAPADTSATASPFHSGELKAQRLAGTRGVADELGVSLQSPTILPSYLQTLLSRISVLPIASLAGHAQSSHTPYPQPTQSRPAVWVSVVLGHRFVTIADPGTLALRLAGLSSHDVLRTNLAQSHPALRAVGVLVIDLEARRRWRINGVANHLPINPNNQQARLHISVRQSFPNCPKYIQVRNVTSDTLHQPPLTNNHSIQADTTLSPSDRQLIARSDTFFLGTYHAATGLDCNHRGGRPGFVRVQTDTSLFWPDYRGNGMFQSFGNLQENDSAGITFLDFDTGHVLQLSGRASVQWTVDKTLNVEPAAARIVRFQILQVRRSVGALTNYRWTTAQMSPYNPMLPGETDDMDGVGENGFPLAVTLVKVRPESSNVKTFRFLSPRRIPFLPGQYATFDFGVLPQLSEENIVRSWTLSEAANSTDGDLTLEVSVKRKHGGLMSNWLHDHAKEGLKAKLLLTDGDMSPFLLDKFPCKLLLLSGGIGITPNMAILRGIGARKDDIQSQLDVMLMHQERYAHQVPFRSEINRRAMQSKGSVRVVISLSGEQKGVTFDDDAGGDESVHVVGGRVNLDLLMTRVADIGQRTVFLCGPPAFMESMKNCLTSAGVQPDRIMTENFNF